MSKENGRVGSSFDSFLEEQGTLEETTNRAIKRVLARQIAQTMQNAAHAVGRRINIELA
jgi:hypothetical protein